MLTLTKKEYEIEEPIQLLGENNEKLYEFTMQITSDELNRIKELLFDEKSMKDGKKLGKLDINSNEYDELEEEVMEEAKQRQEELEKICFKEHREPFRKVAGEGKYLEMVDLLFDFFVNAFVEKRAKQVTTINTNLRKITNK